MQEATAVTVKNNNNNNDFSESKPYKTYTNRWWILWTVSIFNIANNSLWISFASVASHVADYYKKDTDSVDLLSSIGFAVGIPLCIAATWILDRKGLKFGLYMGISLTFLGGLLRFLSTLEGLKDHISLNGQFWMAFVAQALVGIANPLAVSVPTKVSQHWFPIQEQLLATSLISMSMPIGIVLGFGITPTYVTSKDDIPLLNEVLFGPAILTFISCIVFVKSSKPPTPPSASAEVEPLPYLKSMKKLLTTKAYWFLMVVVGGAIGYFNVMITQLQQLMCARGYSDTLSGLCGSLLLGTGFIGAILFGILVEKTGKMTLIAKILGGLTTLTSIGFCFFLQYPDYGWGVILTSVMFGILGFGMYPLALELSVEATYPVDEASSTAILFLMGQIVAIIFIFVSQGLEKELSPEEIKIQVQNFPI